MYSFVSGWGGELGGACVCSCCLFCVSGAADADVRWGVFLYGDECVLGCFFLCLKYSFFMGAGGFRKSQEIHGV